MFISSAWLFSLVGPVRLRCVLSHGITPRRCQGEKDVRGVATPKLMMEIMELMDVNPLETLLSPFSDVRHPLLEPPSSSVSLPAIASLCLFPFSRVAPQLHVLS